MEIRKLNTLRGIAALIVVFSHYSNDTSFLNGALGDGAGQFGVMIFFLISGFLMSYLYMGKSLNSRQIYKYTLARIARVVPLYLVIVLCSYALQKFGVVGVLYDISNVKDLFAHLALLSGTSVLWTIPTEIQFYVVFVFLWWLWNKQKYHLITLTCLVMIFLIYFNFPRIKGNIHGIPFDTALIRSLPYFMTGVLFGQLYINWAIPTNVTSRFFILPLLTLPLFYPVIYTSVTDHTHAMWKDVGIFFVISFVFFSITFLVPNEDTLLSNRLGDFLGKISYSLYLLHMPILWQIKNLAADSPNLFLPVYITLTIAISYISYLIIEHPLRIAIKAISSKRLAHNKPLDNYAN